MKRILCALLACACLLLPLVGCGEARDGARVKIVCTVFPLYDWVRTVVGDRSDVEILWLTDNGSDPHSFQPSAKDMVEIATADLVVYIGGVSDAWVEEALKNGKAGSGLALSEEEGIVLRAVSSESGHGREDGHSHEVDEHIWLSLRNASVSVSAIARRLGALDGENADTYAERARAYAEELRAMDLSFAWNLSQAEEPRLVFADRFPFVYLTEDYGIEYRAAFSGCTTDTDADFSTVDRLAGVINEWDVPYVMVTEGADRSLAESVIRATKKKNQTLLSMESMQAVRREQAENGMSYLSVMEENLRVLLRALELDLDD